jgi:L-ascorbate metabolism protein UlaG (beta-lactamase superfamily)
LDAQEEQEALEMPKLLYQGHGSYRLESNAGLVIYVDPYAGDGYRAPADIILVTHQHSDHNQTERCFKKRDCEIITNAEALDGGTHNSFSVKGVKIQAVEASNINHDPRRCVGYIIELDGILIYAAGDTSKTAQMDDFAKLGLDYALLPADGVYNMDLREAAECARIIKAKHNIAIHLKPGALFDFKKAEKWDAPNKLIIEPGEEIEL